MSVRQRQWRDPKTGAQRTAWMVDVIYEHPDGRVQRVRETSPVQTKRGAEAYERQVRQALLDGTYGKEEKQRAPTFEEFQKDFLRLYAKVHYKPSSLADSEQVIRNYLMPAFRSRRIDAIGKRDIAKLTADLLETGVRRKDGLSKKTVANSLGVLRKMLNVAEDWGVIDKAPRIKAPKLDQPKFDFFDFDETDRLLAAADAEWHPFLLFQVRTGLREGEARALRWEDVDLVKGRVLVRRSIWQGIEGTTKTGKEREVPLGPETIRALKAHRHLRGKLVFCSAEGAPLTHSEMRAGLHRACRKAGLRQVGMHTLRHTFASHLVMRGVPIKVVQELLGHASIKMTMRYAHLAPDIKKDAVLVLEQPVPRHNDGTTGGRK